MLDALRADPGKTFSFLAGVAPLYSGEPRDKLNIPIELSLSEKAGGIILRKSVYFCGLSCHELINTRRRTICLPDKLQ